MNPEEIKVAEQDVARLRECCASIQKQLGAVLIGREEVVRLLLTGLMSGGHMLVIGVPGLAKTMMVKALSDLLGWDFRRIQFTPDLMPADITGTEILQADEGGQRRDLVFRRGPIFANLILADEINRTPPKTQAALHTHTKCRADSGQCSACFVGPSFSSIVPLNVKTPTTPLSP